MKLSVLNEAAAAASTVIRRPQRGAAAVRTASATGGQQRCACGSASCGGCQDGGAIERMRAAASTRSGTVSRDGEVETETQGNAPGAAQGAAPAQALQNNHCAPSGVFSSIPSGTLAATLSGGRLQAPFKMRAKFDAAIPCSCAAGEYRQAVRGKFTANGATVTHNLGPGRPMSDTTFQEDGDVGAGTVYGHRAIPGTKSRFLPTQADGCLFEGEDEPGIGAASGTVVTMHLDFIGTLIDTSASNRVLATSSWSVAGSATMP